ncbi:MAG: hypothetical protein AAF654_00765 [Myxococcota bacterium]
MARFLLVGMLTVLVAGPVHAQSESKDAPDAVTGGEAENGESAEEVVKTIATPPTDDSTENTEPKPEPEADAVPAAELSASAPEEDDSAADLNQAMNGPGVADVDKDWLLIVSTSTSVDSGNFTDLETDPNPTFGNDVDVGSASRTGSIVQSFDLRYQYNVKIFGRLMRARARWLLDTELSTPNDLNDRRVRPFDISLDLTDMAIFKDDTFGILTGGVRMTLPVSRQSRARDQWTQLSAFSTLIKPFSNGLVLFGGARVSYNFSDAVTEIPVFGRGAGVTGAEASRSGETQLPVNQGFPNPDWSGALSFGAQYSVNRRLTFFYSTAYILSSNVAIAEDEFTSPFAQGGDDIQTDLWSTGLAMNYVLNDVVTDVFGKQPFSLSGGFSVSSFHPTTTADNSPFLPFFYQAFSNNRAASNFAQVSANLIATY